MICCCTQRLPTLSGYDECRINSSGKSFFETGNRTKYFKVEIKGKKKPVRFKICNFGESRNPIFSKNRISKLVYEALIFFWEEPF